MPTDVGRLADEVTILRVKVARLTGPKRAMALVELGERDTLSLHNPPADLVDRLQRVNERLWDLEELRREHMAAGIGGELALAVADQVTRLNDLRARTKREISEACGCAVREVKSHAGA